MGDSARSVNLIFGGALSEDVQQYRKRFDVLHEVLGEGLVPDFSAIHKLISQAPDVTPALDVVRKFAAANEESLRLHQEQFKKVQAFLRPFQEQVEKTHDLLRPFREQIESAAKAMQPFFENMQRSLEPLVQYAPLIAEMAERDRLAKTCVKAGLFPYHAIVSQLKLLGVEDADSEVLCERFSVEIWPILKDKIQSESQTYDPDVAGIIAESLRAYDLGCFSLIPPAVFAHIERATRRSMSKKGGIGRPNDWLTNQISELTPNQIGGIEHLEMYRHLSEDAYQSVRDSTTISAMKFPNRHVFIHGLTQGSGRIDALNSILFAHFVFLGLAAIEE